VIVSQAALYRENAHKIRRLVAGVTGSSRDEALSLAQEYEARAQELDKGAAAQVHGDRPVEVQPVGNRPDGGRGTGSHAASAGNGLAERIAALIGQRGAEVEAIRARELDHEIKLAAAKVERALLEARIAGIIEASAQLSFPPGQGADTRSGDGLSK
jgi:hypothetical protein